MDNLVDQKKGESGYSHFFQLKQTYPVGVAKGCFLVVFKHMKASEKHLF